MLSMQNWEILFFHIKVNTLTKMEHERYMKKSHAEHRNDGAWDVFSLSVTTLCVEGAILFGAEAGEQRIEIRL